MSELTFFEDFSNDDFELIHKKGSVDERRSSETEDKKSFDEGYTCGWNDAIASKEEGDARIREELSSALQEMNFTYFEARQHAVSSVKPILQAMVDAVLPRVASENLGARIVELLSEMTKEIMPAATITCAPDSRDMLQLLVDQHLGFSLQVISEPTFTTSQAALHLNNTQISINLDETISAIKDCIDEFYSFETQKEATHA